MKMTKRIISIMLAVITLVSIVSISAEALSLKIEEGLGYGYMVPVNYNGTKVVSTVKVYGSYDYIDFYIQADDFLPTYFFYEIYSDKNLTDCVQSDYIETEDRGTYSFNLKLKLKGKYKTKTYYVVTYAAQYDEGKDRLVIDADSMCQFKLAVDRTTSFSKQKVMLKEMKNTTKGAHIKWSSLSGANKYYIYRRSITGSKWTKVGSVSKSKTSFTDTSVKNKNVNYIYTVKAVNKKGTASEYHYAGLTCLFAKTPALKSVEVRYNNTIEIKWAETSSKANYYVYRKADGGSWKKVATCDGTWFKDTNVKNGVNYTYTVKAVISTKYGKAISSYYSNSDKEITYLSAPHIEDVSAVENGISVKWKAVDGSVAYSVFRKPLDGSASWKVIDEVSADVNEYIDTTASTTDGKYLYTVRSESKTNKGSYDYSGRAYVVLQNPEYEINEVSGEYYLKCEKVPYANEYVVYSRVPGGEWVCDGSVWAGNADKKLNFPNSGEREFAVAAVYKQSSKITKEYQYIYSDYENNTFVLTNYPDLPVYYNIFKGKIQLYWQKTEAEGYNVYKTTDENAEPQLVANLSAEELEYFDTEVEENVQYIYTVKGVYNGKEQTEGVYPCKVMIYPKETITEEVSIYYTDKTDRDVDGLYFNGDMENAVSYIYDAKTDAWKRINISSHEENQYVYSTREKIFDDNNMVKVGISFLRENGRTAPEDYVLELDKYQPQIIFTQSCTKNGVKITIEPDAQAVSYKVNAAHSFYEKFDLEVAGDTPLTCSFKQDELLYDGIGLSYGSVNIMACREDGSTIGGWQDIYFVAAPHLIDAKRNSDGYPVIKWHTPYMNPFSTMHIYRKAPGGEWECIKSVETSELKTKKFSGYKKESLYYVDKTAESGVKYTYSVQQEAKVCDVLTKSYFDNTGVTTN